MAAGALAATLLATPAWVTALILLIGSIWLVLGVVAARTVVRRWATLSRRWRTVIVALGSGTLLTLLLDLANMLVIDHQPQARYLLVDVAALPGALALAAVRVGARLPARVTWPAAAVGLGAITAVGGDALWVAIRRGV